MSDQEREYWLAGGDDKTKAEAFIKERGDALVAMADIAKRHGGDEFVTRGSTIAGLCFPTDECPAGWREVTRMTFGDRRRPVFMPKRTTKALKAICADLASVHAKGAGHFTSHMGGKSTMKAGDGLGMRIMYMSWEFIGDVLLLSVPVSDGETSGFASEHSRKLAMSEYWAMREAAEKAAAP